MANHKSAAKRARQSPKKATYNSRVKGSVRTFEKKLRKAIADKQGSEATKLLSAFGSQIDKAAQKGVLHAKTAARKVSRLAKQVHGLSK